MTAPLQWPALKKPTPTSVVAMIKEYRPRRLLACLLHGSATLALCLGASQAAASNASTPQPADAPDARAAAVAPSAPADLSPENLPLRDADLPFRKLGLQDTAYLRGIDNSLYLPVGVRRDEVVRHARLTLRYAWSPSMLPDLTQLRISLNGETISTIAMPRENAGTEQVSTIDIDPRYFSDYNQLRLQFIGHYTITECEDPLHSSLWLTISPESKLDLQLQTIGLPNELALLPEPFFDPRDGRRLDLPFVFAHRPDIATLRAAGKLASWFGGQAAWRGARFPSSIGTLPDRHAVVFAVNGDTLGDQRLEDVKQPTLRVLDHPGRPGVKLLLIQAADTAQFDEAVLGLALGQAVLTGPRATITDLKLPPQRKPYDAPLWLRTDGPVRFGDLVSDSNELQTSGFNAPPIRINLRVPPDLLAWRRDGVPIDLRYRYVAPVELDNSVLAVSINEEFVRSFRLLPQEGPDSGNRLLVPLLDADAGGTGGRFEIPAFQVGADNQLQFRFALDYHRKERCLSNSDLSHAAIDPESTIDLSGLPHYTTLPNLALFANAGFPFSKYADLSDTLVVLPDEPTTADIETLLYVLGRIGRQTGAVATQLQLVSATKLDKHVDADLLVIDGRRGRDLLQEWQDRLPVQLDAGHRSFRPRQRTSWFTFPPLRPAPQAPTDGGAVAVAADGGIAALLGFESPLHGGRSVVAITATTPAAMTRVIDALDDGGRVRRVRGDTTLFHGDEISSWRGGETYDVGSRPWWLVIWMFLSRHPLLLVLFAVAAGLVCAFVFAAYLRRRAGRRLENGS